MASQNPTPSSQLNAGPRPTSYGAFRPNDGTPSNGPSHGPAPHIPRFAAPGPASSQSPQVPPQPAGPPKRRTSLATSLAIVLFQVINILALYRSETLANYIKFESEALRASIEASALVAERERWEREKENMRHDREMWEKVPEDHIPPGARWGTVSYIYGCRAYGKREYEGVLLDIPKGWSAIDACMNTPVSIKVGWNRPKVEIRQPHRCASVGNSLHGYWIVDRDQDDCEPKLKDVHDTGCTNYRSGLTRIEAQVVGILDGQEQDWRVMCETIPFAWDGVNYTSPTHCEERPGTKVAMWDVPAESCR